VSTLLEEFPYPENLDNHFAVDPVKWDFYSMDCYRILGRPGGTENKLAEIYADQVLLLGTDATGTELSPMRNSEAPINLGVIAAPPGPRARPRLRPARHRRAASVHSLLMASSELATLVGERQRPAQLRLTSGGTH
jgi:hypothetical protein